MALGWLYSICNLVLLSSLSQLENTHVDLLELRLLYEIELSQTLQRRPIMMHSLPAINFNCLGVIM